MQIVDVDDKLAIHAKVWRVSDGGFQRDLDETRIPKMNEALIGGSICPAIILAKIGNELLVIDGQHRLEAWKKQPFPLKAMIANMKDKKDAAKAFITINTTQKRVKRSIVLMTGDSPWCHEARRLATKFKITVTQADAALEGTQGGRSNTIGNMSPLDKQRTALTEIVLAAWTRDKRWTDVDGCFSKPGLILLVCRSIRDMRSETAVIAFLKNMLSMDYSRTSALTHNCGRSPVAQKVMMKIINKELDDRIK